MKYLDNIWNAVRSVKNSAENYSGEFVAALGASSLLNDVSNIYHDTFGVPVHQAIDAAVNIPHDYFNLGPAYNVKEHVVGPAVLALGALLIANDKRKLNNLKKRSLAYKKIEKGIVDEIISELDVGYDFNSLTAGKIYKKVLGNLKNDSKKARIFKDSDQIAYETLRDEVSTGSAYLYMIKQMLKPENSKAMKKQFVDSGQIERLDSYLTAKEQLDNEKAEKNALTQQISTKSTENAELTGKLNEMTAKCEEANTEKEDAILRLNSYRVDSVLGEYLAEHGGELLTGDPDEIKGIQAYLFMRLSELDAAKWFDEDDLMQMIEDKYAEKSAEYRALVNDVNPSKTPEIRTEETSPKETIPKVETMVPTGIGKEEGEKTNLEEKIVSCAPAETKPEPGTWKGNGGSGSWGLSAGGCARSYASNADIKKYVRADYDLSRELDEKFAKIDAAVKDTINYKEPVIKKIYEPTKQTIEPAETTESVPYINSTEKSWEFRGSIVDRVNRSNRKPVHVALSEEKPVKAPGIYEQMKAARVNHLNFGMIFDKKLEVLRA